jgi:hypothetical protein
MLVLRDFVEEPLVYETGGMYPPVRFCPRALQRMAKTAAEADLRKLLQTPVLPPAVLVPLSNPRSLTSRLDGQASSPIVLE